LSFVSEFHHQPHHHQILGVTGIVLSIVKGRKTSEDKVHENS
jgi:hypothetical protein